MKGIIPIEAVENLGVVFGFDQVIVLARRVGDEGTEQLVTWGDSLEHKHAAARIGDRLTTEVFGWTPDTTVVHRDFREGGSKERCA